MGFFLAELTFLLLNLGLKCPVELSLQFIHRGWPHSSESELFLSFIGHSSALVSKDGVNENILRLAA